MQKSKEIKYSSPALKSKENVPGNFQWKALNFNRAKETGVVNDGTGSSVSIKEDGEISLSASELGQIRISPEKILEVSTEHHSKSNRHFLDTEEIIINNHKLNPQLIELSDTRVLFSNPTDAIGNLMLDGTVLVKTWEPNLNKYVLMRRRIRTPMFSTNLNSPMVPEQLDTNVGYVAALDLDSAILMQKEKTAKDKVTADQIAAEGGQDYNQGNYNSYGDDFAVNSDSITSQGGMMTGMQDEIINNNPNGANLIWPVPESMRITSPYGSRDGKHHNGIDIGGKTPGEKNKTVAVANGVVTGAHSGSRNSTSSHDRKGWTGYGNFVEIKHDNGYYSLHAHLDKVYVKEGDKVEQGRVLGLIGTTGSSSGVHLHYTIWGHGVDKVKGYNPVSLLKPQN